MARIHFYYTVLLLLGTRFPVLPASFCNVTCQADKEIIYLATIQDKILSSLHLRAPPKNITRPKLSDKQIEDLLGAEYEKDDFDEKKIVVLPAQCPVEVESCFRFPISRSSSSSIMRALLRFDLDLSQFAKLRIQRGEERVFTFVVRRVYEDGTQEEFLAESEKGNDRFDIELSGDEIRGWRADKVVGLTITVEHDGESHLIDNGVNSGNVGPTLIVYSEARKRRDRRHGDAYCPPDSSVNHCCLQDMIIDFAKLGWTFIMAPPRYNAYMCRGECHYTNNHAVRYGHSKLIKDAFIGGLHCCHPSEYESLKIIYTRSDNEIIVTRVPGMIARRCACT